MESLQVYQPQDAFEQEICILFWNIHSLTSSKIPILLDIMKEKSIDLAAFVETKSRFDHNILPGSACKVLLHGKMFENQSTRRLTRGGSAIYIMSPELRLISHEEVHMEYNEIIQAEVTIQGRDFHFFTYYKHPKGQLDLPLFRTASQYEYSIILGDFNCSEEYKEYHLKNLATEYNMEIVRTAEPTLELPGRNPTWPDLVVCSKRVRDMIDVHTISGAFTGSDHHGLLVNMRVPISETYST